MFGGILYVILDPLEDISVFLQLLKIFRQVMVGISFHQGFISLLHQPRALSTHCVKSARIWSFSGPYFPHSDWIRRDTHISPYSVRMRENTDQKNSEYRHFSRSDGNHHSSIALWTLSHVTVYAFFFLWNVYFSQT